MLGHDITHVASPNEDMRLGLLDMATAAVNDDQAGMDAAAAELRAILYGTTEGRIYDGFAMLNYNRWLDPDIDASDFPSDAVPGEYKMKEAVDTGNTFVSPYDGEIRRIWEITINMLYYDGQIDSDTFLVKFPFGHHPDDILEVDYRIFSLVLEDFSPTVVMLDRRQQQNTVNFPFKGLDSVWVAFDPGQVVSLRVKYPPIRQIRGVYTWGWRVHPPRIQFLQPVYEIQNAYTGDIEFDPQGESFVFRNREELTLEAIADEAPEMKMLSVVGGRRVRNASGHDRQLADQPQPGPARHLGGLGRSRDQPGAATARGVGRPRRRGRSDCRGLRSLSHGLRLHEQRDVRRGPVPERGSELGSAGDPAGQALQLRQAHPLLPQRRLLGAPAR
jgi:hypothetical protein